jgi:hypothetical protein
MNRRGFLLASGSTVLTGSTISSLQRPSLGLEFELSAVPNKKTSNVDSITVQFTNFEITPVYLDESMGLDISVELDIQDQRTATKTVSGVEFTNGQTIDGKRIQKSTGKDLTQVFIDRLDRSENNISGAIYIWVDHPEISQKSYHQPFSVNKTNTIDNFEDGDLSEYSTNDNTSEAEYNVQTSVVKKGSYALELKMNNTKDMSVSSTSKLPNYPSQGDLTRCWVRVSNTDSNVAALGIASDGTDTGDAGKKCYSARLDVENNSFYIQKRGSSNNPIIASDTSVSLSPNIWYEIEFIYKKDNTLEAEVFDEGGSSISNRISGSDSEYAGDTGIAYLMNQNNKSGSAYFDNARIV